MGPDGCSRELAVGLGLSCIARQGCTGGHALVGVAKAQDEEGKEQVG